MGTGRTSGDRRLGGAAAVGAALLVVLLFAAPILFLRISEARQRLDALLRRTRAVNAHQDERLAAARSAFDRQVDESSRAQDEELEYVETRIDRMLPRPVSEVRLPETLPLPRDVVPAVAPKETESAPEAAVHVQEAGAEAAPRDIDEQTRATARGWVAQLTRRLGLTPSQQEEARRACEDYLHAVTGRAALARQGQRENVYHDVQRSREEAIQRIGGLLTTDQAVVYQDLVLASRKWAATGVVLSPLPGTTPASH